MRRSWALGVLILGLAAGILGMPRPAEADEIWLRNGHRLQGRIVGREAMAELGEPAGEEVIVAPTALLDSERWWSRVTIRIPGSRGGEVVQSTRDIQQIILNDDFGEDLRDAQRGATREAEEEAERRRIAEERARRSAEEEVEEEEVQDLWEGPVLPEEEGRPATLEELRQAVLQDPDLVDRIERNVRQLGYTGQAGGQGTRRQAAIQNLVEIGHRVIPFLPPAIRDRQNWYRAMNGARVVQALAQDRNYRYMNEVLPALVDNLTYDQGENETLHGAHHVRRASHVALAALAGERFGQLPPQEEAEVREYEREAQEAARSWWDQERQAFAELRVRVEEARAEEAGGEPSPEGEPEAGTRGG